MIVNRNFLICLILILGGELLVAQVPDYAPLSRSFPDSARIVADYEKALEAEKREHNGQEAMQDLYDQRRDRFMGQFKGGDFIYDPRFQSFFERVLGNILNGNPDIHREGLNLYLTGLPYPNAACWGDGNFTFNLSLLRRLNSEDEVAFVLCHELAHYLLEHVPSAMKSYSERISSKETKQKIKEIERMEYGARAEAMQLVRELVFDGRRHSRFNEAQADSFGLALLLNTQYDPRAAISCLGVLDQCDERKYTQPFLPEKLFVHPDYPYRSRWAPSSNNFEYSESLSELNEDSLKTHPECNKRIGLLAGKINALELQDQPSGANTTFDELVLITDFEYIESHYQQGDMGACIMGIYQLRHLYPDHPWLIARMGQCFYRLYRGRIKHNVGNLLEFPTPRTEKEYRKLLGILNNLRMSEMAKAGFFYLDHHLSLLDDYEPGLAVYVALAKGTNSEERFAKAENHYRERFPSGTLLNNYPISD